MAGGKSGHRQGGALPAEGAVAVSAVEHSSCALQHPLLQPPLPPLLQPPPAPNSHGDAMPAAPAAAAAAEGVPVGLVFGSRD